MRLRFLKTTPSDHPDFPFQAGQIIPVNELTRDMKRWIKDGAAVVLPEPEPEQTTLGAAPENAALTSSKPRGNR